MSNRCSTVLIFIVFMLMYVVSPVLAQSSTSVECGTIIEGEFTGDFEEQYYAINLGHGDKFTVDARSLERSGLLSFGVAIYDPDSSLIADSGYPRAESQFVETALLISRGDFTIKVVNSNITFGKPDKKSSSKGGIGRYALYIGCTLRDGSVIEPGDTMPASTGSNVVAPPVFSGFGFPGLSPVDFANAVKLPLIASTPMTGAITPNGGEILGFQFDANAGDVMELDFSKLSGNLNLGLVVLSANNEVVFQASLVTSESLSTRLTLPSGGQYTIGVFRIDLLPPAAPEATAFQVTGTLNP